MAAMSELTPIQQKILEFIIQSMIERQAPPTMREIAQYMGYRSDNAAYQHLLALQRKGVIRLEGRSRGITVLVPLGLPVIGRVAAGSPILAEENVEQHLSMDGNLFQRPVDFLLRVTGMSMRDAGILDGDLIAVHRTPVVRENEIVVARIDNDVTVKRFRQQENIVTLLPENPSFSPIRIDPNERELVIEGVMVGLIRQTV